ncbi:MAG: Amuc_1098 family type IV pilus outer membrane protein [Verrucomicrobiota bacterium]
MALGLSVGAASTISAGESSSTVSLAEREVMRRSQVLGDQVAKLEAADNLLRSGQSAAAYKAYEEVFQTIPNIPTAQALRAVALEGYLRSGLILAREKLNAGDYAAVNLILDTLDRDGAAKGDRGIVQLRLIMNDPDRFPPALTPKHIENVAEVKRLLVLAASQEETGMFDKALVTYEDVLRIDPTNSAARRGMEKVERERSRYFNSARDHQRSRMLNGVSELWEDKPRMNAPPVGSLADGALGARATTRTGKESIADKLRELRIAKVDFSGATLEEVIEYLRVRARDADPTKKGIDFVLGLPPETPLRPVSLSLIDVPVEEILRYATEVSGVTYRVEEFAVRIVSLTDTGTTLISRTFRVPPDFISGAAVAPVATAPVDPFAAGGAGTGTTTIQRRMGAKEFLESRGILFPEGGGANYNPVANMLIVRTTASNLEMVESLVEQSLNSSPKMAVIEVKLLEINSGKLEEMGFDWLLGGFGTDVQLGGGTGGNQQGGLFGATEFPVVAGLNKGAMGPVTAGLRSSADLDANRTIDNILFGGLGSDAARSPGAFSLSGVFTNPQFQMVLRALDQKDGLDLVAKPSVITKSGQKASVEIIRELIYPTEFDPPQIPTNIGNNTVTFINGVPQPSPPPPPIPVTPTTPTAFETRRVGVVLDVEPVISEDGRSVDVTLTPEFTEFVGFVNYGSPINTVAFAPPGLVDLAPTRVELTPNIILQPIFATKKIVSSVKIYDGATIVLGGVISDQEIMIDDHVPVIGKLPVIGKAFQSKVKQRRLKNMLMFVSVKVVDPSGRRVNQP